MSQKEGKPISTKKQVQQVGEMFSYSAAHNAAQRWKAENNSRRVTWQITIREAGLSVKDVMHVAYKWFLEFEWASVNMF